MRGKRTWRVGDARCADCAISKDVDPKTDRQAFFISLMWKSLGVCLGTMVRDVVA